MNAAHGFGISFSEVLVHSDDVNSLARQAVKVDREGRNKGLALSSFHFCNPTKMQCSTTHQLHVVMALTSHPQCSLSSNCEGFNQQVIEIFTAIESPPKLGCFSLQLRIRQRLIFRLKGADLWHKACERLYFFAFTGA